jgi:FtsP/CotA-like multicopper oxidase with cupredoxin domain
MLNTLRIESIKTAGLKSALAAILLAGTAVATAAPVTVDLCATTGSTSGTAILPAVPVWGYATGACLAVAVTAPGGPVINAVVGDVVTVNLGNSLPEATGLIFQGQAMVPDVTGAAATTGTKSYTFTVSNPGTFLYQAAPIFTARWWYDRRRT